jgi:hypothetical protein
VSIVAEGVRVEVQGDEDGFESDRDQQAAETDPFASAASHGNLKGVKTQIALREIRIGGATRPWR